MVEFAISRYRRFCSWGRNGQDGIVEGGCGISPDIDISGLQQASRMTSDKR